MKVDTAYSFTPALTRQPAKSSGVGKGGEQVALSEAAEAGKAVSAPVNQSRVAEIKTAIAEGRFRVNPEAIADRLIRTAQEMIDAERRV
ncbi:MAG: flagellar biosynthesis anti-sigma factor FlgM [Zoogloeaceae bacterium]|jgi:negative regulator of flagellin synthesis FlgM|nr:flagellar biosynthesis anti-sigma factor FlgM [Zoogloeaceae bacterium]